MLGALVLAAGPVLAGPAQAAPRARVTLPGSVSPALAHSTRTARLDPGREVSLAVTLRLRHPAALDRFLAAVQDPRSPSYRHFLTPRQFRQRFGPTPRAVDQVTRWLRDAGLRVTDVSGSRQVVDVTGTATRVERAFATALASYTDTRSHRRFYATGRPPSLPAPVARLVLGVAGLDSHAVRHTSGALHSRTRAAPTGLTPQQLRAAYHLGPLGDGGGTTIALWEFDGYRPGNIRTYDQRFSTGATAPHTVSVDGAHYDGHPGAGQPEVELDIEVAHAVAGEATTLVYEAPNTDAGQIDMAAKIASDAKADVVSISWGACEQDSSQAVIKGTSNQIKQAVAEGISFFAASGDDGSADCARSGTGPGVDAVDYPASDPNVTGVGGTTLSPLDEGRYAGETAWSGSGGGISRVFARPGYQHGTADHRTVPDVAAAADPSPGYACYTQGGWHHTGGTSAASPLWAAFAALATARTGRLGNLNPALYRLAGTGMNDVTSGGNGSFAAGPGYDLATGWGSLDAATLSVALDLLLLP